MFTGLIQHIGMCAPSRPLRDGGARLSVDLGPLAAESKPGDSHRH